VLREVEAPTFSLDNPLTDGGEVVSLTCRPHFPPRKIQAIMRLEGLGQSKKSTASGT
jgi:hypothetical protein